MNTTDNAQPATVMSWILTMQWPIDGYGNPAVPGNPATGHTTSTGHGTTGVIAGTTRTNLYKEILKFMRNRAALADDIPVSVLFFSLAPDQFPEIAQHDQDSQ